VNELTVAELRALIQAAESAPAEDPLSELLFEEVSFRELRAMTGLSPGDLDAMKPSEIRAVLDKAKQVNADFFGWRARMFAGVDRVVAWYGASTAVSAPLSGSDTATS
jgi:hypothetical protein